MHKEDTATDRDTIFSGKPGTLSADKAAFCLTAQRRAQVSLSASPLTCAAFVMRINRTVDGKHMELLKTTDLENALLARGLVAYAAQPDGTLAKVPTKEGEQRGLLRVEKQLLGGGTCTLIQLSRAAQAFLLSHINALVGQDAALDAQPTPSPQAKSEILQKSSKPQESPPQKQRSKYDYCWNCNGKVAYRFTFRCPSCGWPICPLCGACRAPKSGFCAESKKGMSRFSGLLKLKNEMRTLLLRHNLLDGATFADLSAISSPKEADDFRKKYAELFAQLDVIAKERHAEKEKEKADRLAELRRNEKGFFKIVTKTARFITYQSASGMKKTVPNRPPVRVGTHYVDLSAIPKEEW